MQKHNKRVEMNNIIHCGSECLQQQDFNFNIYRLMLFKFIFSNQSKNLVQLFLSFQVEVQNPMFVTCNQLRQDLQLLMKLIAQVTLIFLICSTSSFIISETNEKANSQVGNFRTTGLQGFPYKIGKNFGNQKVNTLINFISAASTLYRDDYRQNMLYIQKSMAAAYENAGVFSLIIQGNSTNSRTDTFIYGYDNQASLQAGINMINPTWSYYAYFKDPQEGRDTLEYILPEARGAGINQTKADDLNKIIKKGDGIICKCDNIWLFSDLNHYDGQAWNVVCHSSPTTYAYIPSYNSQWLATHPGPCHYLIYVL